MVGADSICNRLRSELVWYPLAALPETWKEVMLTGKFEAVMFGSSNLVDDCQGAFVD